MNQTDELAIQLKVLRAEEAKRDLEAARRAVESMSSEAKRGMIDAAAATERQNEALRRLTTEQTEAARKARDQSAAMNRMFNLEVFSRVISVFRQLGTALDAIIEKNDRMRAASDHAAEALERTEGTFAAGFERGSQLSTTLDNIANALGATAGAADLAGSALGRLFRYITGGGPLGWLLRNTIGDEIVRGLPDFQAGGPPDEREMGIYARQNAAMTSDAELAGILGEDESRSVQPHQDMDTSLARQGSRGGGSGAAREAARVALEAERALYEDIIGLQDTMAEADAEIARQREEDIRAESAAWAELNRANIEGVEAKGALMREQHELAMREMEIEKEYQRQVSDERRSQIMQAANAAASVIQTTSGVFGELAAQQQQQITNITSALRASGASQAAIAKAVEAHESRLDKLRKAEGGLLIAYNTVRAATETAEAIADGASMDFGAAVAHGAAAAAYAAAAAMAAVKLGSDDGGAASAPAPVATSHVTPAASKRETEEKRGGGATLKVMYMGSSDPDFVNMTERANWQFDRGGYDKPARGLGYYG